MIPILDGDAVAYVPKGEVTWAGTFDLGASPGMKVLRVQAIELVRRYLEVTNTRR